MFNLLLVFLISFPVFAIKFESDTYFSTKEERTKIERASVKVTEVVNSQCFEDFMTKRKLISTNNRTPKEVVDHIRSIKEAVKVKMYFRCMRRSFRCLAPTSAVAYRQPPEKIINLNRAAFTLSDSDCEWASTMAHEGLGHALGGYGHTQEWTNQRDYSVPYSLGGSVKSNGGDAFTNCCK